METIGATPKFNFKTILKSPEQEIAEHKEHYKKCTNVRISLNDAKAKLAELIKIYSECDLGLKTNFDVEEILKQSLKEFKNIFSDMTIINEFEKYNKTYILEEKRKEYDSKHSISKIDNQSTWYYISELLHEDRKRDYVNKISDKEINKKIIQYRLNKLKGIQSCLNSYGLHPNIKLRDSTYLRFNIFLKFLHNGKNKKEYFILLNQSDFVKNFLEPYNAGKNIMLKGMKANHDSILEFHISSSMLQKDEAILFAHMKGFSLYENDFSSKKKYFECCTDVTQQYINTSASACILQTYTPYISDERVSQLQTICNNKQFDLSKLIQLCNELNLARKESMVFTQAILVRSILDHVPKVFGLNYFSEIINNYYCEENQKSFKETMQKLESVRKIADSFLHSGARTKEALPTNIQVDFRQELDVLLQEVFRKLK